MPEDRTNEQLMIIIKHALEMAAQNPILCIGQEWPQRGLDALETISTRIDDMQSILKMIVEHASPEEGQRWRCAFTMDEKTYADWHDLAQAKEG